jgi:ESS family glutamate:Na+ symporter
MRTLLLVLGAVAAGQALNSWAHGAGIILPGFLAALLCGAAITNGGALLGARLAAQPVERLGEMSLQAFLAMYLMGLKIWTLGGVIGPLAVNVVLQVGISALIAGWVLYKALGSDYDAAVTAGGFFGFGVSSMPVAFATMEQVSGRYGASPKAFLLITLAGSFFVDIANAVVVQVLLKLPLFR